MTRKLKTQTDRLKEKLLKQYALVASKFKPSRSKEISNQEVMIALYQYSTSEPSTNEYGERDLEWLHDRLVLLTQDQMAVIKKRFWEAKSFAIIANELGHLQDPMWASRKMDEALKVLRAKA